MDRQERRTRTLSARRRAEHLRIVHNADPGEADCLCELSPCYFAKRRALGCDCRKRPHGAPKGVGGARPYRYEPLPTGKAHLDALGRAPRGIWKELMFWGAHKVGARDRIYRNRHLWRQYVARLAAGREWCGRAAISRESQTLVSACLFS